ncbi:MAG: CPBP family intramembrane glutamic endopeptidase [Ferruginibacter sp.]
MEYRTVKGFSGFGQLGMLFVFLGLGFILAGGTQLIIAMQMIPAGTPMKDMGDAMMKAMLKPENVAYARLAQVTGTLLLLFIPALLYSWVTNGRNKFWLGFNRYVNAKQILIGFFIIFFANLLAAPVAEISKSIIVHFPSLDAMAKKMEAIYNEQVVALSNLKSWPEFLMAILIMAFFPALFEEVFFRGALQNLLVRWWRQPIIAILVTSVVFSLIHMSIYLFFSRLILGFLLGLMYHKTKNIWVNVIAHFINNAIAVCQLFYLGNRKEKIDVTKLDPEIHWSLAIVGIIILYYLFVWLNRSSTTNKEKIMAQELLILEKENVYDPFSKIENR